MGFAGRWKIHNSVKREGRKALKLRKPAPRMCLPPGPGQAAHIYLGALRSTRRLSGHVVRAGLAASATAQVWRCIACPDPLRPSSLGPSRSAFSYRRQVPRKPGICSVGLCLLCSTLAGREGLWGSLHVQGKVGGGGRRGERGGRVVEAQGPLSKPGASAPQHLPMEKCYFSFW